MGTTGPKVRLARQVGIALTPKAAKYLERRPYPPGEHGRRRQNNRSPYKVQLLEKQRLRYQYDIGERQLRNVFAEAKRHHGPTSDVLLSMLERRLDAVVLRAGFARSIYQARQFVSHGHIEVDGRRVNRRSYRVVPGQIVAIRAASKQRTCFSPGYLWSEPPDYLEVDREQLRARLVREPFRDEIPVICDLPLVVEYYSR